MAGPVPGQMSFPTRQWSRSGISGRTNTLSDSKGGIADASTGERPGDLDWDAFCARYFPGRRRHDFEALTAYGAYKGWGKAPHSGRLPTSQSDTSREPVRPAGRDGREARILVSGTVKSFNGVSGHGFIVPDRVGKDLWVHQRNIIGDRRTALSEGERVEFELREGGMGPEAINVHPLAS
jgi:cold shock protein